MAQSIVRLPTVTDESLFVTTMPSGQTLQTGYSWIMVGTDDGASDTKSDWYDEGVSDASTEGIGVEEGVTGG